MQKYKQFFLTEFLEKLFLKDILPITLKEKDLQLFTKLHQMP